MPPAIDPIYQSNFIQRDSSAAAGRESMEPRCSRCKFFLAFLLRHAHTHMQINTGPRPPSGSVDMSADFDILPQPASLPSIRGKKKNQDDIISPLCVSLQFSDCCDLVFVVCLFEERTNECKCKIARKKAHLEWKRATFTAACFVHYLVTVMSVMCNNVVQKVPTVVQALFSPQISTLYLDSSC